MASQGSPHRQRSIADKCCGEIILTSVLLKLTHENGMTCTICYMAPIGRWGAPKLCLRLTKVAIP